jgi:hypothetical protein
MSCPCMKCFKLSHSDYGLPFLIKSKNVIRVRQNHWPKLNYDFTGQIHEFRVRLKFGTRKVSTLEVFIR